MSASVYSVPQGYLKVTEARDRLHDKLWPDARYEYGKPDPSAETPEGGWDLAAEPPRTPLIVGGNIHLQDERYADIDRHLIAAIRAGTLAVWIEVDGQIRRVPAENFNDDPARPGEREKYLFHGRYYRFNALRGDHEPMWWLLLELDFTQFAASVTGQSREVPGEAQPRTRGTGLAGRPSLAAWITSEHERRCVGGAALRRVTDEAQALAEWLLSAHPGEPSYPTIKTIRNRISPRHRLYQQTINNAQN
jgi:hypothetical protein